MVDLRERLQELADAATRDGATPGPAHAIRRGRQRRRRLTAGVASLLAVALAAGAAGATGRLPERATQEPLAPAVPSTTAPPVEVRPEMTPGAVAAQLWEEIRSTLGNCLVSTAGGPQMVAKGTAYGRTWVLGARPPGGRKGMCWASGESDARGGAQIGMREGARSPSREVVASGTAGDRYGSVHGYVTKRAATVQVLFKDGRAPLDVVPLRAGPRFPVNFYLTYYPQGRTRGWAVAQVLALDPAGRVIARCRTVDLRPDSCSED